MNEILTSQSIGDFQRGDERTFRQVFDHYYQALSGFVYKLTGSREEAEDISLRCFQSLFNRCHSFGTENNIKAFLFISARNSSLNFLKAKERDKHRLREFAERMKDDTFLEYEYSLKTPIIAALDQAIESLPHECRRIFKMLYYDELAPAEVAALLQISINTVYTQRRRAVSTLRLKLSENATAILWLIHTLALLQYKIPHPAGFIQI